MKAGSSAATAEALERWNSILDTREGNLDAIALQISGTVDVLDDNAALRRALTDPSRSGDDKAALATSVFAQTADSDVIDLISGMVRARWSRERDLPTALERTGLETLLAHAQKQKKLERMTRELFDFSRLLERERDLRTALTSKDATVERRQALLHDVVGSDFLPETVAVLDRTVSSPRYTSIVAALKTVAEYAAERVGQRIAIVTAAVPLNSEQVTRLESALTVRYGIPVRANVVVEPGVVGGIRVAVGNDLVDHTIATRIERLRRDIAGN